MLPRTVLLLLFLSAVAPGAARAQSPAPDAGTATRTPGVSRSPAEPAPDAPNVLHLTDAVQAAIDNQPQLVQARAAASAAEGRVVQARSPLLPQLTPQASWTRSYRALTSVATGGTGTNVSAQCVSSTCNTCAVRAWRAARPSGTLPPGPAGSPRSAPPSR